MGTPSPWGSRPVGDPVVRLRRTYRARLRPPIHPLDRPRWTALRATEVARSHGSCPSMARRRLRASFRRMRTFIVGDWTSGNSALAVSHGPRGTPPWTPPDGHRFPDMLFSPSGFRLQVSQATQEPPSEFIPTASGIQRSASRRTPCMRFSRTLLSDIVHRQACTVPDDPTLGDELRSTGLAEATHRIDSARESRRGRTRRSITLAGKLGRQGDRGGPAAGLRHPAATPGERSV
jgi:hypothetical protein